MSLAGAQQQLGLLTQQEPAVVGEFCKLSLQLLRQGGVKPRVFASAANKLDVQPQQVEDAVRGLIFLFIEGIQMSISSENFQQMISKYGFSSDASAIISKVFEDNREEFNQYLTKMGVQVPRYNDLEWRFDILVGSRSLHHIAEPLMTLQLSLDNASSIGNENINDKSRKTTNGPEKLLLQTDPNNLVHMTKVLEEALQESHNHHFRRITRHMK